jgi:hypothetical protein
MWKSGIISGGDSWGYYLYLPAIFIYDDLDNLKQSVGARLKYHHPGQKFDLNTFDIGEAHKAPTGNRINKYTTGVAIFQLPFFLLAHGIALAFNLPADGYSFIYIYMVHLACIFYALAGLLILRKVLLLYVSDLVCALTLLAITLGTNLYYFTVYNSGMAHTYLFMLYCFLIYFTSKWYRSFGWKSIIGIGLAAGFITMMRPTEIICLFIPVLWGIHSFKGFSERLGLFKQQYLKIAAGVFFYILAGLPQLIYWKLLSGHFLYYSYTEEGFNFLHPRILDGLFSFKNGWLTYTPLMYLALAGIFFLRKKNPAFLPILFFLPLHIYIIYSWWCWNYINGLGSRPMVETYALLSIPLAYFLQFVFSQKYRLAGAAVSIIGLFFIYLNLFNTYQLSKGVLWSEDANWQYYKNILGKTKLDYLDLVRYDINAMQPEGQNLEFIKTLAHNNYEDSTSKFYSPEARSTGRFGFVLNPEVQFGPGIDLKVDQLELQPGDWVKISIDCMNKNQAYDFFRTNQLATQLVRNGKELQAHSIRMENKVGNPDNSLWGGNNYVWGTAYLWMKIPKNLEDGDVLRAFTWNPSAPEMYIDNLAIQLWRKKE